MSIRYRRVYARKIPYKGTYFFANIQHHAYDYAHLTHIKQTCLLRVGMSRIEVLTMTEYAIYIAYIMAFPYFCNLEL